jgi:hypothetical protein
MRALSLGQLAACGLSLAAFSAPGPAVATPGAQLSAAYCRGAANTDALAVPDSLAPAVANAFGVDEQAVKGASYYRCAGGRLLACVVGANLPYGKADVRRRLPGADDYCRQNPGSTFIPMAVTGHDTIYAWRCAGASAAPGRPVVRLDGQGFVARTWKRL